MGDAVQMDDFAAKFSRLSEHNQKYIIAIQQALMFAQENEKRQRKNGVKGSKGE